MKEVGVIVKKEFYKQNDGELSRTPPDHLSTLAKACWRKIVPFLESTKRVKRIDSGLVKMYCINYEIFRKAYEDISENGIQTAMYKTLQDQMGQKIGRDFVGYKKNPAVGVMKDAVTQLNSIGVQLGLTPKGRQELKEIAADGDDKQSVAKGVAKFFGKDV